MRRPGAAVVALAALALAAAASVVDGESDVRGRFAAIAPAQDGHTPNAAFDHSATCSGGASMAQVTLYWTVEFDTAHFKVVGNFTGWLGFGFTVNNDMIGPAATPSVGHVYQPDKPAGQQVGVFHLLYNNDVDIHPVPLDKSLFAPGPASQQGGVTQFEFSRRFDVLDGGAQMEQAGPTEVLCAQGKTNKLEHHKAAAVTQHVFGEYTHSASLMPAPGPPVKLYWRANAADIQSLDFKVVAATNCTFGCPWVGVGVSNHADMLSINGQVSNGVLAIPSKATTPAAYYHILAHDPKQVIETTTAAVTVTNYSADTQVAYAFTRAYDTNEDGVSQMPQSGATYTLCAVGPSSQFGIHQYAHVTPLDLGSYNNSAQINSFPNVTMYWTVGSDGWVDARTVAKHVGWVGTGISANGKMIGPDGVLNNAVIGKPGDATAIDIYALQATAVKDINPMPSSSGFFAAGAMSQANGITAYTWRRKLNTGSSGLAQINDDGMTHVLLGLGKDNTFAHHEFANVAAVDFGKPAPPPHVPSNGHAALDENYALDWVSTAEGTVEVTLTLTGTAWVGFGVSPSGKMVGPLPHSDAVIGRPDLSKGQGQVDEYTLGDYHIEDIVPVTTSTLSGTSLKQEGGKTVLKFTRALGAGSQPFEATGETRIIWAYGASNTFEHHTARGSMYVDFTAGGSRGDRIEPIRIVHGIIMALAFGVCFPAGLMMARFTKHRDPRDGAKAFWFVWHKRLQYTGTVLLVIGLCTAVYMCRGHEFQTVHSFVGAGVGVLTLLQPINASMRPKPGKATPGRELWELIHKTMGRLAVVGGFVAMFLGIYILEPPHQQVYVIAAAVLVSVHFLVFVFNELKKSGDRPKDSGDEADMYRNSREVATFHYDELRGDA